MQDSSPGQLREASSATGWSEHFVNPVNAAATAGPLEAVSLSHSVLLLDAVATADECALLVAAASTLARRELEERAELEEFGLLDDVMLADAGRVRLPVENRFDKKGQALCDMLLLRALSRIAPMHDAAATFGECVSALTCLSNALLHWSPGEPAVNVYAVGGDFKPHEDEQLLTILIPLTNSETTAPGCSGDFSGGGTAFWPEGARGGEDEDGQRAVLGPPSFVLTPPAGSALLFGGQLTHAAQPVIAGERAVFVGSFTPAGRKPVTRRGEDLITETDGDQDLSGCGLDQDVD